MRFRLHRSLKQALKRFLAAPACEVRFDSAFGRVIRACAAVPRPGQSGTWITPQMVAAYEELHAQQLAHSVEVWAEGRLLAGLYLVALGRAVFGESMFTRVTDGSKIALAALVAFCRTHALPLIDCQIFFLASSKEASGIFPNELKTRRDFSEAVRELFASRFGIYGFYPEGEFLYVRKRNAIYDCIRFYYDEVSTFLYVKAYVWSDRFECADWSPFSEFTDDLVPAKGCVRTSDFINDRSVFDGLMREVSGFVSQFKDERDYIDYVGKHGNCLAAPRYQKIRSLIG